MATERAFIAVVQRGDERSEQETEIVTIREEHGLPTIELTDGTRIQALEPAGETHKEPA